MTPHSHDPEILSLSKPPLVIQILAIIGFTGFAIPVSIVAMNMFGVLGLLLAAFLAYQWTRLAGIGTDARLADAVSRLKPQVDDAPTGSGNASFDSYRDEMLDRLEVEQTNFEGFMARLRDAKDKGEFDTFLVEREQIARETSA
ncbi:DUF2852 domain-containing protein [Rhodobacteraceae bacterium]|nr:DUF2852 domain-containing protein [Paracoccaceae bacterium]